MKKNLLITNKKNTILCEALVGCFEQRWFDLLIIDNTNKICILKKDGSVQDFKIPILGTAYLSEDWLKLHFFADEYLARASELEFITYSKSIEARQRNRYSSMHMLIAAVHVIKTLCYDNVIFLSNIEDLQTFAFAFVSSKMGKAKILTRTAVLDKVFWSSDYFDKTLKIDTVYNKNLFKTINLNVEKSVWTELSNLKNSRSISKFNEEFTERGVSELQTMVVNEDDLKNFKAYIYYPLHNDPGRTTQPEAGIYQNQLLNIQLISSSLPEGYKLLVKEHPRQFDNIDVMDEFRPPSFYSTIINLDNVVLVDHRTEVQSLLKHCSAVFTATGTTGWEALKLGIPVILAGRPWYFDCFGTIAFEDYLLNNERLKKLQGVRLEIKKQAVNLESYVAHTLPSLVIHDEILVDRDKVDFLQNLKATLTELYNEI